MAAPLLIFHRELRKNVEAQFHDDLKAEQFISAEAS